jgi:phosphocarrier protein
MKQFTYRIEDPNGMHARPAGMLATFAKKFQSDVRVRVGEKEADGKRLLSLMSLGAVHGSELTFTVTGEDEERAARELEEFCCAQKSSD